MHSVPSPTRYIQPSFTKKVTLQIGIIELAMFPTQGILVRTRTVEPSMQGLRLQSLDVRRHEFFVKPTDPEYAYWNRMMMTHTQ